MREQDKVVHRTGYHRHKRESDAGYLGKVPSTAQIVSAISSVQLQRKQLEEVPQQEHPLRNRNKIEPYECILLQQIEGKINNEKMGSNKYRNHSKTRICD